MSKLGIKSFVSSSKAIGAVLLISGTSIGGGMLALPVATSKMGLVPSNLLFLITWLAMTFTAFLMLECNLSVKNNPNLISMSRKTLGLPGKTIAWCSYLLLLYSLLAAYISGTSSLISGAFQAFSIDSLSKIFIQIGVLLSVGLIVLFGIRFVDRINRYLILCGVLCYFFLLFSLTPHIEFSRYFRSDFSSMSVAFPITVTAFGFHIIIPVLVRYLDRNVQMLKSCLLIGSTIPLLIYLGWQISVQGALPFEGVNGLALITQGENQLQALIHSLSEITGSAIIARIASFFCAFAILTSLLGVSISLWDFFRDLFAFDSEAIKYKVVLTFFTFVPAFLLVVWFSEAFTELLGFAGIFVSILLGLLPIAMCFKGRKQKGWGEELSIGGGNAALLSAAVFFLLVIFIEMRALNLF